MRRAISGDVELWKDKRPCIVICMMITMHLLDPSLVPQTDDDDDDESAAESSSGTSC